MIRSTIKLNTIAVKTTLLFLLIFISAPTLAQDQSTEVKFMECLYSSYADEGEMFKTILEQYEQKLIDSGYLEDNLGESYYEFLVKLEDSTYVKELKISSFRELGIALRDIERDNTIKDSCEAMLGQHSPLEKKMDDIYDKILDMEVDDPESVKQVAVFFRNEIPAEKFELNFYKLMFFVFTDRLHQ